MVEAHHHSGRKLHTVLTDSYQKKPLLIDMFDISEILKQVATYKTTIESLAYMESLLMGDPSGYDDFYHSGGRGRGEWNLSLRDVLLKACPPFTKAFQKLVGSTGMLLFYTSLKKKQMILPR